jgi:hypothetical protein
MKITISIFWIPIFEIEIERDEVFGPLPPLPEPWAEVHKPITCAPKKPENKE